MVEAWMRLSRVSYRDSLLSSRIKHQCEGLWRSWLKGSFDERSCSLIDSSSLSRSAFAGSTCVQWFIIRPDHGNDSHRDVFGFHIVFDVFIFTVRFPRSFSYCVFIVCFVSSSSSKNGSIGGKLQDRSTFGSTCTQHVRIYMHCMWWRQEFKAVELGSSKFLDLSDFV